MDHPVAGLVVGVGPVRAGAHDREVDLFVAEVAQQGGEVGSDLGLLAALEPDLEDLAVGRVSGGACRRQPCQLVGALDRTHHRQAFREGPVCRPRQGALEPEQVQRPRGVRDAVGAVWVQERSDRLIRVRGVGPVDDRHAVHSDGRLGVGSLEGRHHECRWLTGSQHQHREPFGDRGGTVAGEPDEIWSRSHEHPRQGTLPGGRDDAAGAGEVVVHGEWRWGLRVDRGHGGLP